MKKHLLFILSFAFTVLHAANEQDLRTILDSQINNNEINIPKGSYVLDLTNGKNAYIFSNKRNIVINGNGSTIVCNRQNQAFQFSNCENVTFSNFVIEYDPPCSTQGTIVEMSADKRTWTVELHQAYPTTGIQNDRILLYGKNTRELVPNFTTLSTSQITTESIGKTTKLRFTIDWWDSSTIPAHVGDYVAFTVRASGNTQDHTLIISSCKYMRFENITVYDSNCFTFLEIDGMQNHYYRCVVTRKKNDPKYIEDRLRAGMADAFHSKFAMTGPIIEECKLEYTGDDCIAINGNFYPVYASSATEKSISFLSASGSLSGVYVKQGDRLICVNNDGSIRGYSVVTNVSTSSPTPAQRDATFAKLTQVLNSQSYSYGVKVSLDSWIEGAALGDVIYSEDRIGAGFKVLRDTVGGNRSRAILIKSAQGIIDGCEIKNSAMSGIALAPEYYWMEAGCPRNVIVRNNTIDNCMFEYNMSWATQFAALSVVSQAPNGGFAPAGGINNISIYNNKITNCPFPAVGLTSIDGVYFADNTMEKSSWNRNHGSDYGITNNRDLYRINVVNFSTTVDVNSSLASPNIKSNSIGLSINNGTISLNGLDPSNSFNFFNNIKIFDLAGKYVFSTSERSFNIDRLSKGIYIIKINTVDREIPVKIAL